MSHRDRLLDGAMTCLREKGYARTTARDIVAASDTNLASIGYHFGSKEALLNEVLGEAFRAWTAEMTSAVFAAEKTGPLDRVRESWVRMMDDFDAHRPLLVAFVESLAPATRSPELRAQLAAQYQELREAIGAMVNRALGGSAEEAGVATSAIASFLMAVCDGLMIQWLLDPEHTPTGTELADALGEGLALALTTDELPVAPD